MRYFLAAILKHLSLEHHVQKLKNFENSEQNFQNSAKKFGGSLVVPAKRASFFPMKRASGAPRFVKGHLKSCLKYDQILMKMV